MRKALMLASAGLIVLAGCSPASDRAEEYSAEAAPSAEAAAEAPADAAASNQRAAASPAPVVAPAPLAPVAQIAYAYRYALSLPRDRGAEMMSRHELACVSAGPGYCQVVSAQADWTAREPGGRLELRGQPEWINRFRSGLALDARNAGGRLDEAVTNGEDVTRDIDAAATGARTTASLADRIRQLQARSGGTMAQRLEIERELAELQQQYDAQQIALRALNDRVQSARLTLDYRQGGVMAADSPTRPVARALGDAFGLSMGMLAMLITAGSVLLPIVVIGGAVWWGIRRRKPASA
ncbi:MAG: DUF4349 domain-containing protein [Alphaproteobacteria bacterium]|uniref:DUF4349 domain-containing protein n=1 Tax=Brevundimonas sp. TaxID=1871086 RepID=UPI0017CF996F|nr:DUF4349 domain-containing protein [Brevundimonas sp.]MBA3050654.1 DUF4349 domain-containing protein [Brevundimonas sp.]MBU3970937.1 DUF4349 domain-containing protein [Alphaproteobacteria bacterium]MBU3973385.1 DUF4349 domain-containing protein [Alphaproteobacteria bacterium]